MPIASKCSPSFIGCVAAIMLAVVAPCCQAGTLSDRGALPIPPPPGAVVLFDGTDTSHWRGDRDDRPAPWPVADGAMTVHGGSIVSRDRWTDFYLHLEWMEPDMPNAHGQEKGNSGVYLQGRHEIQVLDSYGWKVPGKGDCGAVYGESAPLVNACRPALQWQSYDIIYRAPRFDAAGKLVEKARVSVIQNGMVIQNNTEIQGSARDPNEPGPILLQDHGNPVKYRNIWLLPLPAKGSDTYEPQ
jgi:hypothetical protein